MELSSQLPKLAKTLHLDYYGVADLTPAEVQNFIRSTAASFTSGYPRAVSLGLRLSDTLVDLLPEADDRIRALYKHHAYTVMCSKIDIATAAIVNTIQQAGYRALAIPAAIVGIDGEHFAGIFSHKLASHLAGLGWIGKSCMLITPDHGPRVGWGTVLTDSPLLSSSKPMAERCGSCRVCVDICPAGAYSGRNFEPTEPREFRMNPAACYQYVKSMPGIDPEFQICGRCLQACPHGRHKKTTENIV
jgi:epoxyqueuosine reductase QueG